MMTHEEKRRWLIEKLLEEDTYYKGYKIPTGEAEQKDMLRALMNVRQPKPISREFLDIQDEYLKEENLSSGITDVDFLTPSALDKRLILWQGDITSLRVDAIVNAANSQMCGCFRPLHNCVDNIIHSKSGIQLRLKCHSYMQEQAMSHGGSYEEKTGMATITPAYNLPCKYVLHTVGPIVYGKLTDEHRDLLASCYRSCLELAEQSEVKSIAFCCISTGVFMFPNDEAAVIAIETVRNWLDDTGSQVKVVFNVYKDMDLEIYEKLLNT